jgi:hypothetical protein
LKKIHQIALLAFFLSPIFSCRKDNVTTSSSAKLAFSTNEISFDTVFTTLGSVTQYFQVYNNNSNAVTISSISLGAGSNSQFRLNVDGVPGKTFSNLTIPGKDSLFIFVAVTVDPNNQNNPFVIKDSIMFLTNGNSQKVLLQAWGQNAHYIRTTSTLILSDSTSLNYSIIPCNSTWGFSDNLPYVIFGYAVVDSGCTLTINPGINVYMDNNAVLWVYKDATLNVMGTQSNPVIFQSDNLQAAYKNVPGQWGEIWLSGLSMKSTINWAVIENGVNGIEVDSAADLTISHTIVENMTGAAIWGNDMPVINADNCVFANAQAYCGYFVYGGTYSFNQCTFADYWNGSSQRTTPALFIDNGYQNVLRNIDNAYFGNCIIYGNLSSEIGLDSVSGASFNYKLDHCVLLADGTYNSNNTFHNDNVFINQDPLFTNPSNDQYTIDKLSSAIGRAKTSIVNFYPIDLSGLNRLSTGPPPYDLGAYEYH